MAMFGVEIEIGLEATMIEKETYRVVGGSQKSKCIKPRPTKQPVCLKFYKSGHY